MTAEACTRYASQHEDKLRAAREEYAALLGRAPACELNTLLSPKGISFADYCDRLVPNPWSTEVVADLEQFARRHGVWLNGFSRHYVDMVCYAYTRASRRSLLSIGKIYMVDFYLNDTFGRDKISSLPDSERRNTQSTIERLVYACNTRTLPAMATGLDRAHLESLQGIRCDSVLQWYAGFLRMWIGQLTLTHQDRNASALGQVATVQQYIRDRATYSGMDYAVALMEFASGGYVNDAWLETVAISTRVHRLKWLCILIAALSNDLFSFEKEVIDNKADSNLVAVLLLNNMEISLMAAIGQAGKIVAQYIEEYLGLVASLRETCASLAVQHPARTSDLVALLDSIDSYILACWGWQVRTGRYRRPQTIFAELRA
jgi:hypothetical protein